MVGKRNQKKSSVVNFVLLTAALITVNLLADVVYKRFDLTKEKRYTLSHASSDLVNRLDDVVYINIFLDGDLPKDYKRLKSSTRDMLNEFRIASGGMIEFDFEDVLTGKPTDEKEEILKQMTGKGLQVTRPELKPDETASYEMFIIPAGVVHYKNREFPVNLLKRKFGNELEEDINISVEQLEYEISNAIRMCLAERKIRLAFTEGHGELDPYDVADISSDLSKYYQVDRLNINVDDTNCVKMFIEQITRDPEHMGSIIIRELSNLVNSYDGLIIAKPRSEFIAEELLILDQYVMQGGKIIWLIDRLAADMDSLQVHDRYFTHDYTLGIDNLLFRYGVRVNPTLIQDLQCHIIPVMAGRDANRPTPWPWVYYPIFNSDLQHPIVRNMDAIWGQFAGNIDTLPAEGVKKSILLESSDSSRLLNNPVMLSMRSLAVSPNITSFREARKIAGVLLEGEFTSPFAHRPAMKRRAPFQLKTRSLPTKMIVLSDGDLIKNQSIKKSGEVYPLGYDRWASGMLGTEVMFANKNFMLNCIDYLCDDANLIEVRSRKMELRLLDKPRVKSEKVSWQLFNMVLPILLIIILGLINTFVRRKRYIRTVPNSKP